MSETTPDQAPLPPAKRDQPAAPAVPAEMIYARTLLGRMDQKFLSSVQARGALAVIVGLILIVPSVQFVAKIQETEYSAIRQREKHRSAIGRWLPDALALQEGEDPYGNRHWFPNPPLVLLALVPFAHLPIVATGTVWSILKIAAVMAGCWLVMASARREDFSVPLGVLLMAAVLSVRPIMGDITHGNINIFVFFEIALAWYLFVNRRDLWAGAVVGLAVVTKLTPGLLLLYFLYKRAWRVLAGAGLGLVLFAILIPSVLMGFQRNNQLLVSWYDQMVRPYVHDGYVTVEPINQSLPGMFMKWLALPHLVRGTWINLWEQAGAGQLDSQAAERKQLEKLVRLKEKLQQRDAIVRLADGLDRAFPVEVGDAAQARQAGQPFMARLQRPGQRWILRGLNLLLLVALGLLCRSPITSRRDPKLLLEVSLVLLAMLLMSERTWKHHLVTLPIVYLATWSVLACHDWSDRFRKVFVAGVVAQFTLLVIIRSDAAMYGGVITLGLLLGFVQNAILLRGLQARSELPRRGILTESLQDRSFLKRYDEGT